MIKRWPKGDGLIGAIKYSVNDNNLDEWYKLIHHKGEIIYRRDRLNTKFMWKGTHIYFNGNWPDIGYNDLEKFLKRIMPKIKKKWPEEYEYWQNKIKWNYYQNNHIDYNYSYELGFNVYKPVDYKSIYEGGV